MLKVLSVFGTRPEAIKMAPVVKELLKYPDRIDSRVCVTAQHRQMLDQVLGLFKIIPHIDLDLMEENQSLASLTGKAMGALTEVLERDRPDLVLVQGDTTTAMISALAAFYQKVPVGHVEAGLRTHDRYSPFPEEMNRRLISALASFHFAPTESARQALRREGASEESTFLTGNTVIDALLWVTGQEPSLETQSLLSRLGLNGSSVRFRGKTILVTAHRRENFGQPLENICFALRDLVSRNPDIQIVYPVHMNPNVRTPVQRILGGQERIHLIEPLPYEAFAHLMKRSYLILTDSGGIQEEAPTLGKPVLVLRQETERPEAVRAGTAKVVATEARDIVTATESLVSNRGEYEQMARTVSPFGDGHAAERIVNIILGKLAMVS